MKVLVTGGAGYIGSILVPELMKAGHDVTVIDNYMYRQNSLLNNCYEDRFKIIRADVRDNEIIKRELNTHDVIIPLAAIVGMPACKRNPKMAIEVNYEAIRYIARMKSKDQLLLFPNTNSGYGQGEGAVCTEESQLNPISVYGITKVDAEKAVRDVENSVVFRLATVFGVSPKMRLDLLVNDFTYRAWNDGYIVVFEGHFKRNYVHIRDVARLFEWSIKNWGNVSNDVFNFGLSNANLSKLQLAELVHTQIPNLIVHEIIGPQDPDQRNYIVLNDKIESRGFAASISIQKGIDELLKSFNILQPSLYSNIL